MQKLRYLNIRTIIISIILILINTVNIFAIDDGIYIAPVTTHYINPETGRVDDVGSGNTALGEAMTRSAVDSKALVEIKDDKNYITLRIKLVSNISNVKISTQSSKGGSYSQAKTIIKAEDYSKDYADYRFEVKDLDYYICIEFYVKPMGRDVKFYVSLDQSQAIAGNGDFITSINIDQQNNQSINIQEEKEIEGQSLETQRTEQSEPVKEELQEEANKKTNEAASETSNSNNSSTSINVQNEAPVKIVSENQTKPASSSVTNTSKQPSNNEKSKVSVEGGNIEKVESYSSDQSSEEVKEDEQLEEESLEGSIEDTEEESLEGISEENEENIVATYSSNAKKGSLKSSKYSSSVISLVISAGVVIALIVLIIKFGKR